jgi:asparagine synthase (glutamine-hydrolysing)
MCRALAHRGPDAAGLAELGPVVLGHRRLSVIDVSQAANQPLADSTGRYTIVYNGEIYNYPDLREELARRGAEFRTRCDTEVVLEAYKAWGFACLERFNGMFAFGLWDAPAQSLFLARDRTGEKPLFFCRPSAGRMVFASEPKALGAHPWVSREPDPAALGDYLALNYTLGRRSLRRGVRRLEPASFMVEREGAPGRQRQYWDLAASFRRKRRFASLAEAAHDLEGLVDQAVQLRLVSDVPVGGFLSGGLDSSAIVGSMAAGLPAGRVKTYSIGFAERTYSELDQAAAVAVDLGVDHRSQLVIPGREETLASIVRAADEPLADNSVIPTWFLARFARQEVTVALSGDGGDECFAGYQTYAADRLHRLISLAPSSLCRGAERLFDRLVPVSLAKVSADYKARAFLRGASLGHREAHFSWRRIFTAEDLARMARPWWREIALRPENDPFLEFARRYGEVEGLPWLDQHQYVDLKTWLADDILVKVDRATMAHGLESRAPFLDHRVVEFAASLPPEMRMGLWRQKRVLRESQRGRLPARVLGYPKRGFNAPFSLWATDELAGWMRSRLGSAELARWVEPGFVRELLDAHLAGRQDNGYKLFGLLCLGLWLESL